MEDIDALGSSNHTMQGAKVSDKHQILLWNRRLGHPSFVYMKNLFLLLFRKYGEFDFKCETFDLAKSHHTTLVVN